MDPSEGFTPEEIYSAMQAGADDECPECDGAGYVTADCFEDSCCCADPEVEHGIEPCGTCSGKSTGPSRQTPFQIDTERKRAGLIEFRNKASRLTTCHCGVKREWHAVEVSTGRCARFRAMSLQEWAEWLGVDYPG